jgi:hypothetical protein
VLWATRQTEDIDKVKNPDHYVKITLRELIIYFLFLGCLTMISFGMSSSNSYELANSMDGTFLSSPNSYNPYQTFRDVSKMSEIWVVSNLI